MTDSYTSNFAVIFLDKSQEMTTTFEGSVSVWTNSRKHRTEFNALSLSDYLLVLSIFCNHLYIITAASK